LAGWSFQDSKWRQGAVIPRELVPDGILPVQISPEDKLVIISHDCDLVQTSFDAEPFVEFLIAKHLSEEQKDGSLFRGRNSRRLQLWAGVDGNRHLYEISAHDRNRLERRLLENQQPDVSISFDARDIATLSRWFSRRYNRSSFPTTFNSRVPEKIWKKIKEVLKKKGDDVRIFMLLSSMEELEPDKTYRVIVRVVVPTEAKDNDLREQNAKDVVAALNVYLSQCAGIDVIEVKLDSEAEFSLEDMENTVEWDTFDYLSVPSD
jgi:CRISPR/Cas system-associated endoribonuclease Cas2